MRGNRVKGVVSVLSCHPCNKCVRRSVDQVCYKNFNSYFYFIILMIVKEMLYATMIDDSLSKALERS